ncbi:uncharacterized protein LOC119365073 [Triticum dicoccoides]|uniref:uncharacterized protein LOC119365073 n=1 Tax=Triticum dicoccoides TaxID=85692 RepID=UPI000E7903DA|nr:uncharacterized protein LOC119365073 [Triticum dicoccoides]
MQQHLPPVRRSSTVSHGGSTVVLPPSAMSVPADLLSSAQPTKFKRGYRDAARRALLGSDGAGEVVVGAWDGAFVVKPLGFSIFLQSSSEIRRVRFNTIPGLGSCQTKSSRQHSSFLLLISQTLKSISIF